MRPNRRIKETEEGPEIHKITDFVTQASVLHWLIDGSDRLIFASPAFLRFLGMSEKDLFKNALEVIPAFFVGIFEKEHRRVRLSDNAHRKIYEFPLAGGTSRHFLVYIFPVSNSSDSKLIGGEAFDISFSYALHEEVLRANERLLRLTQVATEAIWEWDIRSDRVFRNKSLQEQIGFDEPDMEGLSWWYERIHPQDRERVRQSVAHALQNKFPSWQEEYRFLHADGHYKTMRDRGFVVYDNGIPIKMIGSLTDVTAVRELEDQLLREKFRHQKELTRSILDAQERERTRLGQELHDNVNQILTVSLLYLNLLHTTEPESRSILDQTKDAITAAIGELQAISRNMVLPALRDQQLGSSIAELVERLNISGIFDIRFSSEEPDHIHISESRKIALYRILQEQLKNIIKHSQAKNIGITLAVIPGQIHLMVQDDGIGFDPEQKRKGIGLRNIYDRAALYNGRAELKTRPGEGCELRVYLPL